MPLGYLFAGIVVGALIVWALLAPRLATARLAQAEAQAAHERQFAAQRESYEARLQDLTVGQTKLWHEMDTTLRALLPEVADRVLATRSQQLRETAEANIKEIQSPLAASVQEMRQQLAAYAQRFSELEAQRAAAAARVEEQVKLVAGAGQSMVAEARTLTQALRSGSPIRGTWGEQTLANILDQDGLREGADYWRQVTVDGGRIDFVLALPGGAQLAVDCKSPDFVPLSEATDDATRHSAAATFAESLEDMAANLAKRGYRDTLARSAPFVVMFVPSEAAFRAACDVQPALFRQAQGRGVILASPTTLIPAVIMMSVAWSEHRAQQQAQQLLDECAELGRRLAKFLEHLAKLGRALESASRAYDAAFGSYQTRLEPQIRSVNALNQAFQVQTPPAPLDHRPTLGLAAAEDDAAAATAANP